MTTVSDSAFVPLTVQKLWDVRSANTNGQQLSLTGIARISMRNSLHQHDSDTAFEILYSVIRKFFLHF